jgi:transcriptional pleiotropic regulator of transition state genes
MRIEKIILGGHVMKSTGIVRKVDELGRIVIPREIRNKFEIAEKDPLEIYVDGSSIILKKYEPNCIFCGNSKNLIAFKDKLVCPKCAEKIGAIESTMSEEADE